MKSIYEMMEEDWETYCLMAGIALVEEISKPSKHVQTKVYKGKASKYFCYHTLRLKMVDKESVQKWFDITKSWEERLGVPLIGPSFKAARREPHSGQYKINFTPNWLYELFKVVKSLPSEHTNYHCYDRLSNWRDSHGRKKINIVEINGWKVSQSPYTKLFEDKYLAAGAFIVTLDLEARGTTTGSIDLCMSERYKDFLEFMRKIAETYEWTPDKNLKDISVAYSRKIGINASDQHSFYIYIRKLPEIYELAGPLIDKFKDKCVNLHISRLKKNRKNGKPGESRRLLLEAMALLKESTTTELQFHVDVRTDVISNHLRRLEGQGLLTRTRQGKKYLWKYGKNGN